MKIKIKMLRTVGNLEKGEVSDVNEKTAVTLLTKGAAIRLKNADVKPVTSPKPIKTKK